MKGGMTPIVKNVTKLVAGFIVIFGIYITLSGHLSPGGGFAGGVIVASAAVLVVLAFGREFAARTFTEPLCHVADAAGALAFLVVAICGYFVGTFFANFLSLGTVGHLWSAGTIPVSNLAILVKVAAGLAGVFLALSGFRLLSGRKEL
jgi:multisubunit Na+/H+ antiporter MnhB subunit